MKKIGLLGGSFNPAHNGHKYISEIALEQFSLDEVWWVITPHNPLKDKLELADINKRKDIAEKIKKNSQIIIKILEENNQPNYSYILIDELLINHPEHKFFWLMGADNIVNFHNWKNWKNIANKINIIIFPRNNLAQEIKLSEFARTFENYEISAQKSSLLAKKGPPYWTVANMNEINISATEIRKKQNGI